MPKLNVETSEREKPLLLLVGDKNPLIPALIEQYSPDFKIAYITNRPNIPNSPDIYLIKPNSASLIKNLEEKIDYAVIFLEERVGSIIPDVFDKLANDETRTAVITDIKVADKFFDLVSSAQKNPNFYFLFAGDIYSEDPYFNKESETGGIIEAAVNQKTVALGGNDLKPIFPIYAKDALQGISHVLLGPIKKNKFYYLFYESPQTVTSAIHILERVEPDLHVSYSASKFEDEEKGIQEREDQIQANLGSRPIYLDRYFKGFEKSIEHFVNRGPRIEREGHKVIQVSHKAVRHHSTKIRFFSNALIFAALIFILTNIIMGAAGVILFKNSISDFKKGDYARATNEIKSASTFIDFIDPVARIILSGTNAFGFGDLAKNYNILTSTISLANLASSDFAGINNLSGGMKKETLQEKIADSFFLYFQGTKLAQVLKNETLTALLTPDLPKVLAITNVAPEILGYEREKKYLLLFQNNGELRPTGGFIGSVGEMIVKNGKIEKLTLQDVYEYDGKLKAHIEPHYIVRRYLQPHLYLRDSNFNPNFQESASMAALLYNLEGGSKVDGVIALNFEAVRKIIEEIGPIKLPSYNQTLDAQNTFGFLEKTIDDNFFPGSTQKKDVLQALFNQLMIRLENRDSAIKIARLIPKLANEKQILFAFNEASVQSIFSSLGFGGDYKDLRNKSNETINDFVAVNEANIGVNKANIDIVRSTDYGVKLAGNKIASRVVHTLNNGGDRGYKAYIRVFAPKNSGLTGIKIDGAEQKIVPAVTDYALYEKRNFKAPAGLEVDQSILDGHQTFGFIVNVAPRSTQVIEVGYDNGITIPSESVVNYSLEFVKQPGTLAFPFTLNVDYGKDFSPKEVKGAELKNGSIVINDKVQTDLDLNITLIKR